MITPESDLAGAIVAAWKTNNRVTMFLIENLPSDVWPMVIPGMPRRTVRMIAGHLQQCPLHVDQDAGAAARDPCTDECQPARRDAARVAART